MSNVEQNTTSATEQTSQAGVSRRKLMRAGLSVAPVLAIKPALATYSSQPALSSKTCFTPSRSLSKNTSLSQKEFYGTCENAQSPGNYKSQLEPGNGGSYSWPFRPGSKTFHSVFSRGSVTNRTLFLKDNNTNEMTFGEAIKASNENSPSGVNSIAPGQVAFHIIGAYLNILGGGGAKIAPEAMTVERLQTIWAEYASTLHYKPIANGPVWNGEAIVAYLISNGIVK